MAELHLTPRAILDQLNKNKVTHVVWLPDSETNFMYEQMVADQSLHLVARVSRGRKPWPSPRACG